MWPAILRWLLLLAMVWSWPALPATTQEAGQAPAPVSPVGWRSFISLRGHSVPGPHAALALHRATAIARDDNGRLWVGEYNGLSRVEGDIVHRYPGNRTPGMREGYVQALYPLHGGSVLVGLDREGLLLWSAQRDVFEPVLRGDGEPLTRINALRPSRSGGIWVVADLGLFHWSGPGARLVDRHPLTDTGPLPDVRLFDVLEQEDGRMWLATQKGLYRRDAPDQPFTRARTGVPALDLRLATDPAWVLKADPQGQIWVGLMRAGLVVLPPDGPAWVPEGMDGEDGVVHGGQTIRSLLWQDGRMWVGSDGGGLLVVEGRKARRQPVVLSAVQSGRGFLIRGLMGDPSGRIWAASDRGLFHFDPSPRHVAEIDTSPPGSLPHEQSGAVRSLYVDGRLRLWMGMPGGVVQVFDRASGSRRVVNLPPPLSASHVAVVKGDGRGRIWVLGNGVAWIDEQTLAVTQAGELSRDGVLRGMAMAMDGERVWIGHQEGLVEADMQGRILRRLGEASSGLHSTRVQSLAWHDGQLWAGTSAGLHHIDLERWQARLLTVPGARETATPFVGSLLADGQGLVIGHSSGLSWLPYAPGKAPEVWLDTQGREVRSLSPDGSGGIWFTLDGGAVGHRNAAGQLRHVGARDGLYPELELQRGNAATTPDGSLLVATSTGAVRVDRQLLREPPPDMPDLSPQLVNVWLNGRMLPANGMPRSGQRWKIDAGVERVVVAISARDYIAPGLRHYSYRLEGLDSDWVDAQDNLPLMLYSRLPAGQYTLVMRTVSEEFPGKEWITELPLEVAPHWYGRASVQFLGVLLMIAMGWGGLQLRNLNLHRHQVLLERTIEMRTSELRMANERLDRLAGEDALTGLYNRRRIFDRLAELHARRQRVAGNDVLVLLDLDHFKQVNDRHGHLAGDAVLREVARRIRASLRGGDMAARYGGEELLLVLPDATLDEAFVVVERLAGLLTGSPVSYGNLWISVQASFGVSLLDAYRPVEDSLARADEALYRAKAQGRNRMCVGA